MINNDEFSSNYKLRFLDDLGNSYPDWKKDKLKNNVVKIKGGGTPFIGNKDFYFNGKIPFAKINDLTSQQKYVTCTNINITEDGLNNSSSWIIPENSILYSIYASIGFTAINKIKLATNQAILGIIPNENKLVLSYLYYYLIFYKKQILKYIDLGVQSNLNLQNVKNISLSLPSLNEQQKIGSFLSEIDNYISLQQKEIILTKEYKKSLLEQFFSQKIKFIDENGNNYPDWNEKILEDILTYLQPTKYLSTKSEIKPQGKIKVLTANKSFLLGFSDNEDNIYQESLPVILFDDFTCDSKFVDFNFKVKSSALKILVSKENNIDHKFIYEAMKLIDFAPSIHKRHWISEYSKLGLLLPSFLEQQKIGNLLNNLDQQISQLELEYKNLKEYKNILLNKLIF